MLCLTVIALILFTREKIPLESSSLLVLTGLAAGFELFPFRARGSTLHAVDFFQGFGHEALVAVCSLMIAGQGIVRTGALEPVGRALARIWKVSPGLSLLLTLLVGAFISGFINNVPVGVLFLPLLLSVSPLFVISGLMLLMGILTNIVTNNAAAVIGTPIAVSIAAQMGQPLEAFVLAVLFGANLSYATPMAYKTNLLVMNAGKYTFNDFLRIGVPLVFIQWIALSWVLPTLYGIG